MNKILETVFHIVGFATLLVNCCLVIWIFSTICLAGKWNYVAMERDLIHLWSEFVISIFGIVYLLCAFRQKFKQILTNRWEK